MPRETANPKFGVRTPKPVRPRITKHRRRTTFEKDNWYATATRSIAIANTGRAARVGSQWITFVQPGEADDYD